MRGVMDTCGAIGSPDTPPDRRRHVGLDLGLRQSAIVDADIVDAASELKARRPRALADVDIGGRVLLRRQ